MCGLEFCISNKLPGDAGALLSYRPVSVKVPWHHVKGGTSVLEFQLAWKAGIFLSAMGSGSHLVATTSSSPVSPQAWICSTEVRKLMHLLESPGKLKPL